MDSQRIRPDGVLRNECMRTKGRSSALLINYLQKWSHDTPGKLALIEYETGRQWMYCQLMEQVEQHALCLLDAGIKPGDRIAVMMPLCMDAVALMFACLRTGAVFVPIPYQLSPSQLDLAFEVIRPRLFFYELAPESGSHTSILQFVEKKSTKLPPSIEHNGKASFMGGQSWLEWLAPTKCKKLAWKNRFTGRLNQASDQVHTGSPAFTFFTTQPDGTIKPVLICQENLFAQRKLMDETFRVNRKTKVLAHAMSDAMHIWIHSILIPLSLGASVVLKARFDGNSGIEAIHRHCISMLIQPGVQYRSMLDDPAHDHYMRHSLEWAILCDGPPEPKWMKRLVRLGEKPAAGWFVPEAGGFVSLSLNPIIREDFAVAIGPVSSHISIRGIADSEGNAGLQLPAGHLGTVCLHPPFVFSGYPGNASATRETISREGICYSGRQGFISRKSGQDILYLLDESSKKLQQMQAQWRADGVIHPVMGSQIRNVQSSSQAS